MWWGLLTRLSAHKHTIKLFMIVMDVAKLCVCYESKSLLNLFDFGTHIWSEEELNAVNGSFQSQSSDQEDRKD